jgi:hypothetical protein
MLPKQIFVCGSCASTVPHNVTDHEVCEWVQRIQGLSKSIVKELLGKKLKSHSRRMIIKGSNSLW